MLKKTTDQWIQLGLIILSSLWLMIVVVLPLTEIIAKFSRQDIHISLRRQNTITIDQQNYRIEPEGIRIDDALLPF